MTEKYRASVRTILSRIDSHPEEFREHFGKWDDIQNAVADRIGGERNRLRGLTDEEVKAIYDKLQEHIWGSQFDEHVMEKVLDPQREERELDAYKLASGKGGASRMFIAPQGNKAARSLLQNAIQPGAIYEVPKSEVEKRAEQLGLGHLLKKTINKIKL